MRKIQVCYFSPTGTTREVATRLAELLAHRLDASVEYCSYTLPRERESLPDFEGADLIIWATPVYAGRIPNKTLDYVRDALLSNPKAGLPAVALATFGNRAYDNALAELTALMEEGKMQVAGAAAMVTRHSFSDTLGAGRPDRDDWERLEEFADQVAQKITDGKTGKLQIAGEPHPERYYTPLKANQAPAGFLKAKPKCDVSRCSRCGRCAERCPMGSIVMREGLPQFEGLCIKCQACRRGCPEGAIAFTDSDYHSHVAMIERSFADPKQPEFFV